MGDAAKIALRKAERAQARAREAEDKAAAALGEALKRSADAASEVAAAQEALIQEAQEMRKEAAALAAGGGSVPISSSSSCRAAVHALDGDLFHHGHRG